MVQQLVKGLDIKQDIEIEKTGGFWCQACLVSQPPKNQSSDPRYCQGCYDFLNKEAEVITNKPRWIPKPKISPQKVVKVSQDAVSIMSTSKDKIFEVDIIPSSVDKVTREKRGPKHRTLPEEKIRQFAEKGMGSKAIANRLKNELGIGTSYKTIQRILSGERKTGQLPLPLEVRNQ